ncbi:dynein assembly factor 1, axonemal homolog isoform X2 [Bradysia coprophila]|uniref:dynein assembly factor 1, axonemal homolog isoform X2 n=1 Tax=Bradysia coprophila TaxID=38358 RepID=UPI00187DC902|nr:dynein assembly factor 1, axonemal homolog isoform X2 [Bradysia coprophila]
MVNETTDNYGLSNMTKSKIVNLCKKHKLYVTPRLNDVLYLHYQGFTEIKELDEYVGLKCLYLECNAISEISGLENQSELRCLLLHNNVIKKIENLHHCVHLDSINLSHNFITTIENLGSDILPKLNTLTITNNCLRTEESIANLVHCKTLSVLDLSHNRIDDIIIVKVLAQMPELRVLVLTGNPVVNQIPSYRKTLILNCKSLTYLDSRPVFDVDRACAEAWKRGGYEEERMERMRWNEEERRKLTSSIRSTLNLGRNGCSNGEIVDVDKAQLVDDETVLNSDNNISDDSSNSDGSCNKDFQDVSDDFEFSEIPTKESEPLEALNSSDEFHDVECEDSDDSFVSSLDQLNGSYGSFTDSNETLKGESMDENCSISMEVGVDEKNVGDAIDEIILEKEVDSSKADDTNLRVNSTKITFYCESVDKLMSDAGGDECDEIIQEMTPPCCVTVDPI